MFRTSPTHVDEGNRHCYLIRLSLMVPQGLRVCSQFHELTKGEKRDASQFKEKMSNRDEKKKKTCKQKAFGCNKKKVRNDWN